MSYSIPGYSEERVTASKAAPLELRAKIFDNLCRYLSGEPPRRCYSRRDRSDLRERRRRMSAASRRQFVALYHQHELDRCGIPTPRSTARGGFALRSKRLRKRAGLG